MNMTQENKNRETDPHMPVYFAPMEGITGCLFRSVYEEVFPGRIARYFTPFLASGVSTGIAGKHARELLPENNPKVELIPQLLSNQKEDFETTAAALKKAGYPKIDLNLGCPSQTVVSKNRGSGMLKDPDRVDRFLEEIFPFCEKEHIELSVKTRLGMEKEEEFIKLLEIYNRYPISELILHTRLRSDFYKLPARSEWFAYAYENSKNPLVYNGDVTDCAQIKKIKEQFPDTKAVMIGRGLLAKPWMLDTLIGETDPALSKKRFWNFHDNLLEAYKQNMSGDRPTLFKMKEIWFYLGQSFTAQKEREKEAQKILKGIKKSQKLGEYESVVRLFRSFDESFFV